MTRFFIFLVSFGFSVIGFVFMISYLNLLSLGYNLEEYVKFIYRRPECIIGVIGIISLVIVIFTGGNKDEICL